MPVEIKKNIVYLDIKNANTANSPLTAKEVGIYLPQTSDKVELKKFSFLRTDTKTKIIAGKPVQYYQAHFLDGETEYCLTVGKAENILTLTKKGEVFKSSNILRCLFALQTAIANSDTLNIGVSVQKDKNGNPTSQKIVQQDKSIIEYFYYTVWAIPTQMDTKEGKESFKEEYKKLAETLPPVTANSKTDKKGVTTFSINEEQKDAFLDFIETSWEALNKAKPTPPPAIEDKFVDFEEPTF